MLCKVINNGVTGVTIWFCTWLRQFYNKGNTSLKNLGFKYDWCYPSNIWCELFWCAFSYVRPFATIQSSMLICVQYLSIKWQQSLKLKVQQEQFLIVETKDAGNLE